MKDLDKLYRQSNTILFTSSPEFDPAIKDIIVARKNLVNTICITDNKATEFDQLMDSLVSTLPKSNDVQALAIIYKLNKTLSEIANSFDTMLSLMGNVSKK